MRTTRRERVPQAIRAFPEQVRATAPLQPIGARSAEQWKQIRVFRSIYFTFLAARWCHGGLGTYGRDELTDKEVPEKDYFSVGGSTGWDEENG
jgi:hypothetical protein